MKILKTFVLAMLLVLTLVVPKMSLSQASTTTILGPQNGTTTTKYQGPYATTITTPDVTVNVCYNGAAFPCTPGTISLPISEVKSFTTITGAGVSAEDVSYSAYGLMTDIKRYDYGPTLISDTAILYASLTNIVNRASTVTAKDHLGGTLSRQTFTFDANGNPLSMAGLVGATSLTQHSTYTTKGVTATFTDINGAVTTYTNGACNGLFQTVAALPLVGSEKSTWDCNGAVQTSITDVNGSKYTVKYTDPFWRPISGTDAAGTVINYSYTPNTYASSLTFGNASNNTLLTYDVSGRPLIAQVLNSSGYDTRSQAYDTTGRPATSSLACTAAASAACPTNITVTYDKSNRPISVTDGNATVTSSYASGDVLTSVTDPSGTYSKQTEYDALGRVKSVCEINTGTGSSACGQRIAQTGYLTTYAYDDAGRVTTITQGTQTRSFTYDDLGRVLTSVNPESGTTTYTYDSSGTCGSTAAGSLVQAVDNAGNTVCLKYDAASRLTSITYTGPNTTPSSFFVYDAATVNGVVMAHTKGRLAEAYTCTSCPGTKITDEGFSYDVVGQHTDVYESTPNSGGYYHVAVSVYPNESVNTITMTPAVVPPVVYTLDVEGRPSTVTAGSNNLVSNTTRNASGQVTGLVFNNGTSTDVYGFDSSYRLSTYSLGTTGSSVTGGLSYNGNGTVKGSTLSDPFNTSNAHTCTYAYDQLVRLSSSNCGAVSQAFSYDRFGNISKTGTFSFTPTYSSTTNRMTAIGAATPTYDGNGNLTSDGVRTFTWDAEGRMLSEGSAVTGIVYNALGQMVEQTIGAAHQQIVYLPSGERYALMNGQTLILARVPLPAGAIAVYTSSGLSYFGHVDGLGSTRFTTAVSGANQFSFSYDPFGEPYNNAGVPTSVLSFTGHPQDTVSGLYDTPTREYDPLQGRWISADTHGSVNMFDPQSFNRYAYVMNRPLGSADSTGAAADDGSDLPYAPGIDPANGPSDPFPDSGGLVYSADNNPVEGTSGTWSSVDDPWTGGIWDTAQATVQNSAALLGGILRSDPIGTGIAGEVVLPVSTAENLYLISQPYRGTDNVILQIARDSSGVTGYGANSLFNVEELTYAVLNKYENGLIAKGPRLAFGLSETGTGTFADNAIISANYETGERWSDLKNFSRSVNAKYFMDFAADRPPGMPWSEYDNRLMKEISIQNGTIHFQLEGLYDIDNAVSGTSRRTSQYIGGGWVNGAGSYNHGLTIQELRYLKDNWDGFRDITTFYNGRVPYDPGYTPWK